MFHLTGRKTVAYRSMCEADILSSLQGKFGCELSLLMIEVGSREGEVL